VGTLVTFEGSATGTDLEYEFQARYLGDSTWGTAQGYSTDNTWTWDTTGVPTVGYEFQVNVRPVGGGPVVTSTPPLQYTIISN
jgi:hypothetical protein